MHIPEILDVQCIHQQQYILKVNQKRENRSHLFTIITPCMVNFNDKSIYERILTCVSEKKVEHRMKYTFAGIKSKERFFPFILFAVVYEMYTHRQIEE